MSKREPAAVDSSTGEGRISSRPLPVHSRAVPISSELPCENRFVFSVSNLLPTECDLGAEGPCIHPSAYLRPIPADRLGMGGRSAVASPETSADARPEANAYTA